MRVARVGGACLGSGPNRGRLSGSHTRYPHGHAAHIVLGVPETPFRFGGGAKERAISNTGRFKSLCRITTLYILTLSPLNP